MGQVLVGFSVPALVAAVMVLGVMLWAAVKMILAGFRREMEQLNERLDAFQEHYVPRREMKMALDLVHQRIDPLEGSFPRRRWSDSTPPGGSKAV